MQGAHVPAPQPAGDTQHNSGWTDTANPMSDGNNFEEASQHEHHAHKGGSSGLNASDSDSESGSDSSKPQALQSPSAAEPSPASPIEGKPAGNPAAEQQGAISPTSEQQETGGSVFGTAKIPGESLCQVLASGHTGCCTLCPTHLLGQAVSLSVHPCHCTLSE